MMMQSEVRAIGNCLVEMHTEPLQKLLFDFRKN